MAGMEEHEITPVWTSYEPLPDGGTGYHKQGHGPDPDAPFPCDRHGTLVEIGGDGCPECLAMLERLPGLMTGDERAEEVAFWCEDRRMTIPFDKVWKRIDVLVGRSTFIHEPALAPERLVEEARGTRRLTSIDEVVNDLRNTGKPVIEL